MIKALYIGGPTAIIEAGGFRFITDPTLDPAGTIFSYAGGTIKLEKLQGPSSMDIGKIDYVLLSHDQHADNLDTAGRDLLSEVTQTFTTRIGSQRLGGKSIGLDPWENQVLPARDGNIITITATPARHGPAGIEKMAGDVIGFILTVKGESNQEIYITGDTVFYEGVAEVSKRFRPEYIFLFAGAARTRGPFNLTMGTNDAIDTAFAGKQLLYQLYNYRKPLTSISRLLKAMPYGADFAKPRRTTESRCRQRSPLVIALPNIFVASKYFFCLIFFTADSASSPAMRRRAIFTSARSGWVRIKCSYTDAVRSCAYSNAFVDRPSCSRIRTNISGIANVSAFKDNLNTSS